MIVKMNIFYILKSIHTKLFVLASTRFLDTAWRIVMCFHSNALLNHF